MIFPGPALQLGHKARPAVTGLGVSAYVFAEFVEVAPSKPTYPAEDLLGQLVEVYPERVGQIPLEVMGEMYLTKEEQALPVGEIEWHPARPRGNLIGMPGSCDEVLGKKSKTGIGRRAARLPRRRR